jgi:glycerol uptake facilitator-like aquaporin
MKKTNRFALLAVLGAVLGSALIMGCGGGDAEETTTNSANGTTTTTTTEE